MKILSCNKYDEQKIYELIKQDKNKFYKRNYYFFIFKKFNFRIDCIN